MMERRGFLGALADALASFKLGRAPNVEAPVPATKPVMYGTNMTIEASVDGERWHSVRHVVYNGEFDESHYVDMPRLTYISDEERTARLRESRDAALRMRDALREFGE